VLDLLLNARARLAGVSDVVTAAPGGGSLEETAWYVLGPVVMIPGPARDLARSEALSGHGSRALYSVLARGDSTFLIEQLEALAAAAPARKAELVASLAALPAGTSLAALRARIEPPGAARPGPRSLTLEDAIVQPGSPVAAWDHRTAGPSVLRVFTVGSFRAEEIASGEVPEAERAAMQDKLQKRGLRVGGTYGERSCVWYMAGDTLWIWSPETLLAYGGKGQISIGATGQTKLLARDVTGIRTGPRGVALLVGGREVVLVEQPIMPLGEALAAWLQVPHEATRAALAN
jgi:hypothetical protein